jgi:hypothetical protein
MFLFVLRAKMIKQLARLFGILALMIIVSFVVSTAEIDNVLNNTTINNITSEALNDSSMSNNSLLTNAKSNPAEL